MKRSPLFIVFEGIDGSGKTTQCDLLYGHAGSLGLDAVRLAEPTNGVWGRKIRAMLKEKSMAPVEEQLMLFLKDREDDAALNINPALERGGIVIMDRYYYSNAAYQGAAGMSPERIMAENRSRGFPEPDRVYFIDLPSVAALERVTGRSGQGKDVFEKEPFLRNVRGIYLSIADACFIVIDGTKSKEEIFEIIKKDFEGLL